MDAVFIHSLWRAGSTYLWNRFRKLPEVCAYYEPFQEALGVGTRDELAVLSPDNWTSHHPALDSPYYTEYLPLIGERGIPTFKKSFSADHYFEEDPAVLAEEIPYVSTLIDHAAQLGRRPVLGCCRTLARSPWLKQQFGGTHIVLLRDPRQQWLSGRLRRQEDGHAYFEVMPFQILGKAKWEPARRLAKILGIPTFEANSFFMEHDRYFSLFGSAEPERSYAAFYGLHTLSLDRALPVADLVIDIDRLSTDAAYRAKIELRTEATTNLAVSFQDSSVSRHKLPLDMADFDRVEAGIEALLGLSGAIPHCRAPEHSRE